MHGPTKRAGSVAALEDIATPSLVAKAVMDYTDHIMLVGAGARPLRHRDGVHAAEPAHREEPPVLAALAANLNPDDNWLDHKDDVKIAEADAAAAHVDASPAFRQTTTRDLHVFFDERGIAHTYGTINMNAVTASGDIGSVTTTSGLSWKIPGRVGDSPIIGAGQYCDNEVGAAGSTGRGEANIKVCGAFLAVEFMRQGMTPEAALMKVMERVIAMTETRLLNERGRPYFDLELLRDQQEGRVRRRERVRG